MKKDKFVPMKITFMTREYNQAEQDASNKLKLINEAFDWCKQHIDTSKINKSMFVYDMIVEFGECLVEEKGDAVKIKISAEKLMFLLDIEISKLASLKSSFDYSSSLVVKVWEGEFICPVNKEDFQIYTKDQEENDKLIAGNNLVKALDMVSKYTKIYPLNIQQATSGFLEFQLSKNSYNIRLQHQ
tara:strand:+ start:74 stop:631 length:558 start_codon:yes stop_codon:yes gene_type:complete